MAQAETQKQHIELRPNRSGQPRAYIAGTRVRVQDIYAMAELQGLSPDEIVRSLPHLTFWPRFIRRWLITLSIATPF